MSDFDPAAIAARSRSAGLAAGFPHPDPAELRRFYGRHDLTEDGVPTRVWEAEHLTLITPPYQLWASWGASITRLRCHVRVAESLMRVLAALLLEYPEPVQRTAAGIDVTGGVYNYRPQRGSASILSLHSWGAAIDMDPARNPHGTAWRPGVGLPARVVEVFADHGWAWGNRFAKPDPQHWQATL
jgi:hypothetical protein